MRMHRIIITDECHRLIREEARGTMIDQGARQPDGTWAVEVDTEVLDMIHAHQRPSESVSDVIVRFITHKPPPPN